MQKFSTVIRVLDQEGLGSGFKVKRNKVIAFNRRERYKLQFDIVSQHSQQTFFQDLLLNQLYRVQQGERILIIISEPQCEGFTVIGKQGSQKGIIVRSVEFLLQQNTRFGLQICNANQKELGSVMIDDKKWTHCDQVNSVDNLYDQLESVQQSGKILLVTIKVANQGIITFMDISSSYTSKRKQLQSKLLQTISQCLQFSKVGTPLQRFICSFDYCLKIFSVNQQKEYFNNNLALLKTAQKLTQYGSDFQQCKHLLNTIKHEISQQTVGSQSLTQRWVQNQQSTLSQLQDKLYLVSYDSENYQRMLMECQVMQRQLNNIEQNIRPISTLTTDQSYPNSRNISPLRQIPLERIRNYSEFDLSDQTRESYDKQDTRRTHSQCLNQQLKLQDLENDVKQIKQSEGYSSNLQDQIQQLYQRLGEKDKEISLLSTFKEENIMQVSQNQYKLEIEFIKNQELNERLKIVSTQLSEANQQIRKLQHSQSVNSQKIQAQEEQNQNLIQHLLNKKQKIGKLKDFALTLREKNSNQQFSDNDDVLKSKVFSLSQRLQKSDNDYKQQQQTVETQYQKIIDLNRKVQEFKQYKQKFFKVQQENDDLIRLQTIYQQQIKELEENNQPRFNTQAIPNLEQQIVYIEQEIQKYKQLNHQLTEKDKQNQAQMRQLMCQNEKSQYKYKIQKSKIKELEQIIEKQNKQIAQLLKQDSKRSESVIQKRLNTVQDIHSMVKSHRSLMKHQYGIQFILFFLSIVFTDNPPVMVKHLLFCSDMGYRFKLYTLLFRGFMSFGRLNLLQVNPELIHLHETSERFLVLVIGVAGYAFSESRLYFEEKQSKVVFKFNCGIHLCLTKISFISFLSFKLLRMT